MCASKGWWWLQRLRWLNSGHAPLRMNPGQSMKGTASPFPLVIAAAARLRR